MLIKNVLITTAAISILSAPVLAETVKANVQDYYKTVTEMVPYYKQECSTVEVPIYGTVTRQGSASGGDVLGGMIIGGLLGKGVTGKDNGAAAGAVLGGIIAADKANKPQTEQVITGYRKERQCQQVEHWKNKSTQVYDYSVITWKQNGQTLSLEFVK